MPARQTVAIARGGPSREAEVSRRGAHHVEDAFDARGWKPVVVDIDHGMIDALRREDPAFVFVAAHGRGAEDGTLQELLDILGLPYTGSAALASALCFDKTLAKDVLERAGLPTPRAHTFSRHALQTLDAGRVFPQVVEQLGLPLVVKPVREGSSLGIKLVREEADLASAVLGALAYDDRILIERHVSGLEVAVTVVGEKTPEALPPVALDTGHAIYDYNQHYDFSFAQLSRADLDADLGARVVDVATQAYTTLGCRDFARVDMIIDAKERPQVLEINTIPGLTETGPTPYAADLAGMSFEDFVLRISRRAAGL